jgi:small-conductance mechanosensitive channel
VIVPNANLISSEVINWTLSDDSHRMEIAVGVAYGTNPQMVIDLLVSVAVGHPEVFPDPEPLALFLGFGESSLDFELRAWTGPEFVKVASDLRVAVNTALAEAGIEIPFPQRDLHLRTVDKAWVATAGHVARNVQPAGTGPEVDKRPSDRQKPKEDK